MNPRTPGVPSGDQGTPRPERRSEVRLDLRIPVRVQGYDEDGRSWEEMTATHDTSFGGIAFTLKHAVVPGQGLHLTVPLPKQFRRHDLMDPTYRVYAIVRSVAHRARTVRVGALFLGKQPPGDWEERGGVSRYRLPEDPRPGRGERRQFPRFGVFVGLLIRRLDGSGQEERTVTENVGRGGARVMTSMAVGKGELLMVEEADPRGFRTRAEIREISIGRDGIPRLNLRFLDAAATDRLVSGG
jgi:hypothetical protein